MMSKKTYLKNISYRKNFLIFYFTFKHKPSFIWGGKKSRQMLGELPG